MTASLYNDAPRAGSAEADFKCRIGASRMNLVNQALPGQQAFDIIANDGETPRHQTVCPAAQVRRHNDIAQVV